MNTSHHRHAQQTSWRFLIAGFLLAAWLPFPAAGQTTAFTYQGYLGEGGVGASGVYDLTFTLYNAVEGGSVVGTSNVVSDVAIDGGLFTVPLDFGSSPFNGGGRWLQIGVRPGASTGSYTALSPRQPVTATPYAIRAAQAQGVASGAITSAMLANGAVTAAKLAEGAVTHLGAADGTPLKAVQVDTNGLVGIGTGVPRAGLHIVGGEPLLTSSLLFSALDNTGGYTNLGGAYNVAVSGHLLAVPGSEDHAVTVFNISNAAAPVIHAQMRDGVGLFNALDSANGVAFSGNLLAIAASGDNAVTLAEIGAPGVVTRWAVMQDGVGGFDRLLGASAVAFSGSLLAIASSAEDAVTLVDVSKPSAPALRAVLQDNVGGYDALYRVSRMAFSGNLLGIAAPFEDAVTLVDVSNPASPVRRSVLKDGVDAFDALDGAVDIAFSGNLLAIAALIDSAVTLVDVSNPANPVVRAVLRDGVGGFDDLQGLSRVAFNGSLLAILSSDNAVVTLVDVSQPSQPVLRGVIRRQVGNIALTPPNALAFAGSKLVLTDYSSEGSRLTLLEIAPAASSFVSEGWVGIGTQTPLAPLHLVGSLLVQGADSVEVEAKHVSLGTSSTASGDYATALGYNARASGEGSTAIGSFVEASGIGSTALGDNARASGKGATAMGYFTRASGDYAMALGTSAQASGDYSMALGLGSYAGHRGSFVWSDSRSSFSSTTSNQFNIGATGGVRLSDDTPQLSFGSATRQMLNLYGSTYAIGVQSGTLYQRSNGRFSWFLGGSHNDTQNDPGGGSVLMTLNNSGLTVRGTFVSSSDRELKEDFALVNPQVVLEKVAALPLHEWTYKADAEGQRHLGPMAQDFHAAFGLGADDTHIATVDADGVALAAIQGLNEKVEGGAKDTERRMGQLEAENAALKSRLESMEKMLNHVLETSRHRSENQLR